MRVLDRLVWTQLLDHPCQADHSRCPERARQCAACPHRTRQGGRWAILSRDLATIRSRTRRLLRALSRRLDLALDRPLILWFGLLFPSLCLGACLGAWLALRLAR